MFFFLEEEFSPLVLKSQAIFSIDEPDKYPAAGEHSPNNVSLFLFPKAGEIISELRSLLALY